MTIDLYTKGILTVIAACLVYLCLGKPALMPTMQAKGEPSRVVVAGWVDWKGNTKSFASGDPTSALPVIAVPRR
jgi:hypothetical protein